MDYKLKKIIEQSVRKSEGIYKKYTEKNSKNRPFYSEADFQFRLALCLKEHFENKAEILLEYPIKKGSGLGVNDDKDQHIDIMLKTKKQLIPIEIKYTNKKVGAGYIRRYEIWKDILRVETLVFSNDKNYRRGYVIVVTDDNYNSDISGLHKEFSLKDGVEIKGKHRYSKKGQNKKGKSMKIKLKHDHGVIKWEKDKLSGYGLLIIEIKNDEKCK